MGGNCFSPARFRNGCWCLVHGGVRCQVDSKLQLRHGSMEVTQWLKSVLSWSKLSSSNNSTFKICHVQQKVLVNFETIIHKLAQEAQKRVRDVFGVRGGQTTIFLVGVISEISSHFGSVDQLEIRNNVQIVLDGEFMGSENLSFYVSLHVSEIFPFTSINKIEYAVEHMTADKNRTVLHCCRPESVNRSESSAGEEEQEGDGKTCDTHASASAEEESVVMENSVVLRPLDLSAFQPSDLIATYLQTKQNTPPFTLLIAENEDFMEHFSAVLAHIAQLCSTAGVRSDQSVESVFGSQIDSATDCPLSMDYALSTSVSDEPIHILRLLADLLLVLRCNIDMLYSSAQHTATDKRSVFSSNVIDEGNKVVRFDSTGEIEMEQVESENPDKVSVKDTNLLVAAINPLLSGVRDCLSVRILPRISSLPLLLSDISSQEWVRLMHSLCSARQELWSLVQLVQSIAQTAALDGTEMTVHSLSAEEMSHSLTLLDEAVLEYTDCSVLSLVDVLELMLVDNVQRQEWGSHSGFMRDKKVTHGVVMLTSTVRSVIADLTTHCGPGQSPPPHNGTGDSEGIVDSESQYLLSDTVVYATLQLLTAALSMTMRAYLTLSPSRTRLFQWRVDLHHLLYTSMQSLAELVRFRRRSRITISGDATVPTEDECDVNCDALFGLAEEQFLLGELFAIVQHVIVTVFVVTHPDVDVVLASTLSNTQQNNHSLPDPPPMPATISSVIQLFKAVLPESVVDDCFSATDSTAVSTDPTNPTGCTSGVSTQHNVTRDVVGYCGSHDPSSCFRASEEERLLYEKEQQAKPDSALAGCRGVIFQRIVNMGASNPFAVVSSVASYSAPFLALNEQVVGNNEVVDIASTDAGNVRQVDKRSSNWTQWVSSMLKRRFEMMECEYPKLTAEQLMSADKIKQHL